TDYLNYLVGYLNKDYVSKGEPLFDFLSEVGWTLNLHYSVYFGVIAFVQVSFFFYAFNKERFLYPFLVFFLFTNGEWLSWMNIIRQTLALCVWVYSIKYIEENKVLNYFFWCIVALLLHNSAAILFIFYPILKSGKDYFKSISFQLFLLVSALMVKEIFSDIIFRLEPLIDSYINIIGNDVYGGYNIVRLENNFIESDGTGIAYVFKIVFNIIVILYSKKMKSYYNSKRFIILYFFYVVSLFTFYIFPIGLISITRPFRYFYIFQSIIYAFFLNYLYQNKRAGTSIGRVNAILFYIAIILFLGIFYVSLFTASESSPMWYQFFYEQNFYGYPK